MVKILFLCVFLVNVVFFFWQYRKGAPEIYLPPSYENNLDSAKYTQKIMLLSEVSGAKELDKVVELSEEENSYSDLFIAPLAVQNAIESAVKQRPAEQINTELIQTKQNSELGDLVETDPGRLNNELMDVDIDTTSQALNSQIVACYQLKTGEYTQNTFTQDIEDSAFKLDLLEQQRDVESFLVLTMEALSFQEAVSREEELKQQGIGDLWLFQRGLFKWRISLGFFIEKEQAIQAKELFSEKTSQELEVVPSYLATAVTIVKISAQEEQGITAFEQGFSMIVDQKIDCRKD